MKIAIIGAATFVATLALSTAASAGQCRDPWVTQAITQITGHAPRGAGETLDCKYTLYGGGSWSSYADLVNKVRASYRDPMASSGVPAAALASGARPSVLGNGAGGAGIVASGAGNIVASGAGNMRGNGIVASGAGNIVASGAGN